MDRFSWKMFWEYKRKPAKEDEIEAYKRRRDAEDDEDEETEEDAERD